MIELQGQMAKLLTFSELQVSIVGKDFLAVTSFLVAKSNRLEK